MKFWVRRRQEEHVEDEERYCYCNGFSNGMMIGCDNEVSEGGREFGFGNEIC